MSKGSNSTRTSGANSTAASTVNVKGGRTISGRAIGTGSFTAAQSKPFEHTNPTNGFSIPHTVVAALTVARIFTVVKITTKQRRLHTMLTARPIFLQGKKLSLQPLMLQRIISDNS